MTGTERQASTLEKLTHDRDAATKDMVGDRDNASKKLRLSTLRQVIGLLETTAKAGKSEKVLSDPEIFSLLGKEIKKRKESAEIYTSANRPELANRESAEAEIISAYLPLQLSDEELEKMIDGAIAKTGASSIKQMGMVMGMVSKEVQGRADNSTISALIRAKLG